MSKAKRVAGLGNSGFCDIQVWTARLDANGKVMRDAAGEPIVDTLKTAYTMHNAVSATMLGYEVHYLGYQVATKPVNRIEFDYTSSTAYGTTSITSTTDTAVNATTIWTATYTNETDASITVATVNLLNLASGTETIFASAAPAQVLADNEVMRVNWTHVWSLGGSDQGIQQQLLKDMQDYFEGVLTTTQPINQFYFNGTADETDTPTVSAGGAVTDTTITLVGTGTNDSDADDTMTSFQAKNITGSTTHVLFTKTGLTQDWNNDVTLTATLVITAAIT